MYKKDAASYVTLLQAIVKGIYEEHLDKAVEVVLKSNRGPTLNRQQCMQLLRCCVAEGLIPTRYLKLPACQSLSPEEIKELLQLCFEEPPYGDDGDASACSSDYFEGPFPYLVPELITLPRARELSADSILQLMQRALQGKVKSGADDALRSLAALPQAQQINSADARELVQTAANRDDWKQLDSLCKRLPECAAAWEEEFDEGEFVQQRLQKALAGDRGEEVCSLLQYAKMQQHAVDVLPRVLLAAFRRCGCERQQTSKDTQLGLSHPQLLQLLRLPAAACLSVPVVHELMQLSLQRMEGALLQELVRLPAAQQLSDADIALLLRLAAGQAAAGTAGPAAAGGAGTSGAGTSGAGTSGRADPAEEQQQQLAPPRQHTRPQRAKRGQGQQQEARPCQQQECEPAGSGVLPGLVLQCLQQPKGAAGLFPLLLLPWAQQLPAACVKALLLAAAERHAGALFEHLLQLPQAPRADPEVQAYADIMRFSCAAADPADYAPQDKKRQWEFESESESEGEEEEEPSSYEYDFGSGSGSEPDFGEGSDDA